MRSFQTALLASLCILTATAIPAGAQPAEAFAWRSIGPAISGGRVAAVAGTNRDPSLYYAGAAGGGVWKTTNAGQDWQPVFDGEGVASIGAIAIDPQRSATVWVGTGEANPRNDVSEGDGVYKTTDGGATWTRVLPLAHALVSAVAIDPRNTDRVLVGVLGDPFADGTDRGVYRTLDGGKTWSKVLFGGLRSGISDMAMDPADPDVLYAGLWEFRRTGWSLESGGQQDGLYRSADGGATWTQVRGHGLPDGPLGRIAVAFAPSNPRRIYAILQSKQGLLWRSDDGGATWSMVSNNTLIDERPYYFSHVFVDPSNADHLWSVSVHLTVSTDGGKTFETTAGSVHGDHHTMWIAEGGRRIIEGNDGGVVFSFDNGSTWARDANIPISQLYHVGFSREGRLPYSVCAPLQDNGSYCAPANPLNPRGVSSSQWLMVGGGDGTWAEYDPLDQQLVWAAYGGGDYGGDLYIHDFATGATRSVAPYLRDQNVLDPNRMMHRFNWETPIAFDPFDPQIAYVGGEALFASRDRGYRWQALSGDLTANVRAHQVVTGGITLDATGAETSDTILAIAPSRAARGEIWIGTDDGRVQLTRDGGRRWRNVTPAGIAPYGRFESISPSVSNPGVAYAIYDCHMIGNRAPYVFATADYGAHWRSIVAGLPPEEEARSILVDPRNPRLLYLGLERSLWASWNGGERWERLGGLPPASMRDIRLQPQTNDLLLATHGRGTYVFDDATPLQQLDRARAAGTYLFSVRSATRWQLHRYWATATDGASPPYGALVTYYLAAPAGKAPTAEIVDATGAVVRHYASHTEDGTEVPDLSNAAGLNRFNWDLRTDPATPYNAAPGWNRGADGVMLPPGSYAVRLHVDGHTFTQRFAVRPDPRARATSAQYQQGYGLGRQLLDDLSRIDVMLNALTAIEKQAPPDKAAQARALIGSMTSNMANDQDNDFLADLLRERVQSLLSTVGDSSNPPTAEEIRQAAELHRLTSERLQSFMTFEAQFVRSGQ